MKQIPLYLLLLTLVISACKKDRGEESIAPNQLPPATETGANILACKVNGKAHIYSGSPFVLYQNGVSFTKYQTSTNKYVQIFASEQKYGDEIMIDIHEPDWNIQTNKKYSLSTGTKDKGQYYLTSENKNYKTEAGSGYIIFTQYSDITITGKFAFTAYNANGSHVAISDGFFDIAPEKQPYQ